MSRTTELQAGAVLVRLRLAGPEDLEHLPTVPGPRTVTVTVNLVDPETLPLADLRARGYRVQAFANAQAESSPCADVLVPAQLVANDAWFDRVVRAAQRVYSLDLGPVRRIFARELAAHAAARVA